MIGWCRRSATLATAMLLASPLRAAEPSQPVAAADDSEPALEGKALRERVPDLELTPWPPPLRQTFGVSVIYPFQLMGLGFGLEGYAAGIVRLSGFLSFG